MTATIENRTYSIEATPVSDALAASLIARGFDGTIWMGRSVPTGRQRKTMSAMIYRTASGEFVAAHVLTGA